MILNSQMQWQPIFQAANRQINRLIQPLLYKSFPRRKQIANQFALLIL